MEGRNKCGSILLVINGHVIDYFIILYLGLQISPRTV